jgi:ubiquinol-cytochrome c reductase core subunit 2
VRTRTSQSVRYLKRVAKLHREYSPYFVELLSSIITSTKFTRWELEESVLPSADAERLAAYSDAKTVALELAHAAAFRNGLGSSVFVPSHPSVTADGVKAFASSAFTKGNIAVLGSGIDQTTLSSLVSKHLASLGEASSQSTTPTKYFGGQNRRELHGGPQTIFIGYGVAGAPSAELAVLAQYLNPAPSIKWAAGTSPLSSAIPAGTAVQSVILPYSDATLFGLLVQSESVEGAKTASEAVVKALKEVGTSSGIKAEDVKKAVAKAKFAAASATETRDGFVSTFGPQVCYLLVPCSLFQQTKVHHYQLLGNGSNLNGVLSSLDNVNSTAFFKVRLSS